MTGSEPHHTVIVLYHIIVDIAWKIQTRLLVKNRKTLLLIVKTTEAVRICRRPDNIITVNMNREEFIRRQCQSITGILVVTFLYFPGSQIITYQAVGIGRHPHISI